MKTNQPSKANYRLAARLRGDELNLRADVREAMHAAYLRAIRDAAVRHRNPERQALDESVEWERYGDFLLATGSRPGAVRALREAACCCLGGARRGCGRSQRPCNMLRQRFFALVERAAAWCGDDPRLEALLWEDPVIRQACDRMPKPR